MLNLIKKISDKVEGLSNGFFGLLGTSAHTMKRGTPQMLKAYSTSPWIRAVVDKISYSMASTVWRAYVKRGKDSKPIKFKQFHAMEFMKRKEFTAKALRNGELEELEDYPMLDFLYSGNAYMTSHDVSKLQSIYLELLGESFAIIQRGAFDVPESRWPIPNSWVVERPTSQKPIVTVNLGGSYREFPMEDLIWIKNPDPANPYLAGSGVGLTLGDEIDSDEYAASFIKSYFINGGRPDLLVFADGLNKTEAIRLEQRYKDKSRGAMKAGAPFFINRKIEVQDISRNFKELELTKLREFERNTLVHTFGVPPELLGILENSNRATINSADYLFSRFVLVPRLEQIRIFLQEKMTINFDSRVIIDYDSPVSRDKEFELEVAKAFPWIYETDELRDLGGAEPFGDARGKQRVMNFNTSFINENGEQNPEPDTDPESDLSDPEQDPEPEEDKGLNGSVTKGSREIDIEQVIGKVTTGPFATFVVPVFANIAVQFGQEAINRTDVEGDFNASSADVQNFVNTESLSHLDETVNRTTKDDLRGLLLDAVTNDIPTQTLAKQIESRFTEIDKRRARLIARTEALRVANFATRKGYEQVGVSHKGWLSSRDSKVRDAHRKLDGRAIPITDRFVSPATGATALQPGGFGRPEDDIQCRCTITAELNSKSLDTEEKRVEYWKAFDAQLAQVEDKLQDAVSSAFKEQRDNVLAEITRMTNV